MWQLEFLDGIGLLMPRRNDLRIAFLCPPATIFLWLEAVSALVVKSWFHVKNVELEKKMKMNHKRL